VCIAVLLRRVWPLDRADHQLAVALVAIGGLAWAAALLLARRIARTTHAGRDVMGGRALKLISTGTFVLALSGFVLGWLPPT
jgi:hypothetical protein